MDNLSNITCLSWKGISVCQALTQLRELRYAHWGRSDQDPSTVSLGQMNEQCWEMGECNSDMKGNRKILQATLFLNKNIHTLHYHGLTKPLRKIDSDHLLHLSLHLQAPDQNITSDQQTQKPESWQLFYFTVGYRKDNAWHGSPLLHWISRLFSLPLFSHLEIRIIKVSLFLECFRPDRHKAQCPSCGFHLLSGIKTNLYSR